MSKARASQPLDNDRRALLSNIALLYFGEGLTQSDIAGRMKVSRVTVVNLLREAREQGIIEIRVNGRQLTESHLARDLRERFGLTDVYVSDSFGTGPDHRAETLRQLGRVAAMAFLDIVAPGDRIGVAWGETVMALSDALPRVSVEDTEVCQLIGSMISARVPASENCAIRIAGQIDARCYTLHAPAMVATPEIAGIFRREPTIASQLARLSGLDLVVFSIGNLSPDTHFSAAGMASTAEIAEAKKAGVAGILACRYIDHKGEECILPPQDRLLAAPLGSYKSAAKKMLVVGGTDRLEATRAAIAGGYVTHLCVDRALATELLG